MDKDLREITNKIISKVNPLRVILFGSRATGSTNLNSDIDICIVDNKFTDKSDEFIKIRKALGRSIVPLDILIFNPIEFEKRKNILGTVQYEIDKKGVILYERRSQ